MDICFEGIGQTAATFRAESGIGPGMAVTLTGSGTVGLGEDGDPPCGVALGGARRGGGGADRRRGQGGLVRRYPVGGLAEPRLRRPGRREDRERRRGEVAGAGGGRGR